MRFNSVFEKSKTYILVFLIPCLRRDGRGLKIRNCKFQIFGWWQKPKLILINFRPLIQSEPSGSSLLDPCHSDLGQNGRQIRICVLQAFTPKVQVWHRVERGHYFPMERAAARTRLSLPRLAAKVQPKIELEQHASGGVLSLMRGRRYDGDNFTVRTMEIVFIVLLWLLAVL